MRFFAMRPYDRFVFCRAKSIGFDIGPGLRLTLALSFIIWCPKNRSMHLQSLQCVRPDAAMVLSALRMRIPQLRHIGSGLSTSHHLIDCCR